MEITPHWLKQIRKVLLRALTACFVVAVGATTRGAELKYLCKSFAVSSESAIFAEKLSVWDIISM